MEELDILIEKWDFILQTFKKEYDIQDISFKTWIKPLKIYSLEGNVITLISSEGEMGTVYIERKYLKFIEISICEVMNKEYSVRLISVEEKKEEDLKKKISSVSANNNNVATQNLNPNYTFDTFVVGTNNNLAHAASLAVAETPGQIYNPLFIYGGAGLGKTHLMQAIAHFIIASDPSKKVLYVTSETFTNELIESVKTNKNTEFRNSRNLYAIHILMIKIPETFSAQHISIQIKNSILYICLISKKAQHTARSKSALHICLRQLLNKISCNINKKDIYFNVRFIQFFFQIFCKCFINRLVINTFFPVINRENIYI